MKMFGNFEKKKKKEIRFPMELLQIFIPNGIMLKRYNAIEVCPDTCSVLRASPTVLKRN